MGCKKTSAPEATSHFFLRHCLGHFELHVRWARSPPPSFSRGNEAMSKAFGTFSGAWHHELADVIGIVIGMRVTKGNDPHII